MSGWQNFVSITSATIAPTNHESHRPPFGPPRERPPVASRAPSQSVFSARAATPQSSSEGGGQRKGGPVDARDSRRQGQKTPRKEEGEEAGEEEPPSPDRPLVLVSFPPCHIHNLDDERGQIGFAT